MKETAAAAGCFAFQAPGELQDGRTAKASSRSSLGVSARIIPIAPYGSAGCGNEFGAAAFNEIAGFGNDVFQNFENLAHAGFLVNEFRERREKRSVSFDCSGCA